MSSSIRLMQQQQSTAPRRIRPSIDTSDNFAGAGQIVYEAPPIHAWKKPSLLRPTLFALAVAGSAYIWAATATNEDTAKRIESLRSAAASSFFRRGDPSDLDLAMNRRAELIEDAKQFLVSHLGTHPDVRSTKTRLYTLATEW